MLPVFFVYLVMSLELDWSPIVANLIKWIWFINTQYSICIWSHKSQCMPDQIEAIKSKKLFLDLCNQIMSRHRSEHGQKTICKAFLNVPRSTLWIKISIVLHRLFLDLAIWLNLLTRLEWPWSGRWSRTQWSNRASELSRYVRTSWKNISLNTIESLRPLW